MHGTTIKIFLNNELTFSMKTLFFLEVNIEFSNYLYSYS